MTRIIVSSLSTVLLAGLMAFPADSSPGAAQRGTTPPPAGVEPDGVLALQIRLDRAGFSPGEIDGVQGRNTVRALEALSRAHGARTVSPTEATRLLAGPDTDVPTLVAYTITDADVAGPFTPEIPDQIVEQAGLPALGYRNAIEALGERFHTAPALLQRLNPGRQFVAGEAIRVPNIGDRTALVARNPVKIEVSKGGMTLLAFDGDTIIFAAPVTSGSAHDPLPIGQWKVTGVARHPPFHYNPALFWDASPADEKTRVAPGPNNPVGVVWIDLSKPHYGLHGTPRPEQVGHTASHGCVRLTNWDAMTVAGLVRPGTPVTFAE